MICVCRDAGLADLAVKDWRGKGFDSVLDQLIDRLQSEPLKRDTEVRGHCLTLCLSYIHDFSFLSVFHHFALLQSSFTYKKLRDHS